MLKKIAYPIEPKLKIHKYVVTVNLTNRKGQTKTGFWYCSSLKEVKERIKGTKKGAVIEVFKADHNFIQAYFKEY